MAIEDLIGYYTYRSLLDQPNPVGDFNEIRFAEAELFLHVGEDGTILGLLTFPATPGAPEKALLDISGSVTQWAEPYRLHFIGRGRANTDTAEYEYEYDCAVAQSWENATPPQRRTLTGTVRRNQDHDDGAAPAGVTASFVAVQRDFAEPRSVPGVGLIPEAITMLAGRAHRLRHTVWHTLRQDWFRPAMTDADRDFIRELGWGLDDPPFTPPPTVTLNLTNGAGEDFLYMHRRMIKMVQDVYAVAGQTAPTGWSVIPGAISAQYAYAPTPDPSAADRIIFRYAAASSGNLVPPATEEFQAIFGPTVHYLKTTRFFTVVMRNLERSLRQPSVLAQLPLGAFGNLLEMTIHNWMHMRWTTIPRDAASGEISLRDSYDVDEQWDVPTNDALSDFHSSHLNPIFWRLHGWVDNRIEDWFNAQEQVRPGAVTRTTVGNIPWFAVDGTWVKKANPFAWPEVASAPHPHHDHGLTNGQANGHVDGHDGHHHGAEAQEIANMLKVMERLREVDLREQSMDAALTDVQRRARRLGGFAGLIEMVGLDALAALDNMQADNPQAVVPAAELPTP